MTSDLEGGGVVAPINPVLRTDARHSIATDSYVQVAEQHWPAVPLPAPLSHCSEPSRIPFPHTCVTAAGTIARATVRHWLVGDVENPAVGTEALAPRSTQVAPDAVFEDSFIVIVFVPAIPGLPTVMPVYASVHLSGDRRQCDHHLRIFPRLGTSHQRLHQE